MTVLLTLGLTVSLPCAIASAADDSIDRIREDQKRWLGELDRIAALEADAPARHSSIETLISELQHTRRYQSSRPEGWGVALWCRYALGRAMGLAGDVAPAYRELDEVFAVYPWHHSGESKRFIDGLRMHACVAKAEIAFEAGDWTTCVGAVDSLLSPIRGYWGETQSALGRKARVLRARAALRTVSFDRKFVERECLDLMRHAARGDRATARGLLYTIHLQAVAEGAGGPVAAPQHLVDLAAGARVLASESVDAAERDRLLHDAVRLCDRALHDWSRKDVPPAKRLRHAPRALFEKGVCLGRLMRWIESALCFQGVLVQYGPRSVARRWVGPHRARDMAAADLERYYAELVCRPGMEGLFRLHDRRLEASGDNLLAMLRNRYHRTGSGFDRELCRRAEEHIAWAGLASGDAEQRGRALDDEEWPVF